MPGKSPNHSILSWREPCGVENPVRKTFQWNYSITLSITCLIQFPSYLEIWLQYSVVTRNTLHLCPPSWGNIDEHQTQRLESAMQFVPCQQFLIIGGGGAGGSCKNAVCRNGWLRYSLIVPHLSALLMGSSFPTRHKAWGNQVWVNTHSGSPLKRLFL